MDKSLRSNQNNKLSNLFENEFIDLDNIFKAIFVRRKKYFIFVGSTLFLLLISSTLFNRIFSPVYRGSFKLLISDPMSVPEKKQYRPDDKDLFEKLATNITNNDIPTLIEYLKSPLLIEPLAKKYSYKKFKLINNIDISSGENSLESGKDIAEGVLNIQLQSKKPKKDFNLLVDLSQLYLRISLSERQQRLKDGLDFLDQQEPILQQKNNQLQSELVEFREKFSLIEPESEGISLKLKEDKLKEELSNISFARSRLEIVRNEILQGTLSATGFVDEITSTKSNKSLGLKIKDYDQSLINQIFALENEISKNRIIYREDSVVLKKLKENLDELKPALRKSQLQAVDTALRLNTAKSKDIEEKLDRIERIFSKKPELIKEFNSLKQKLDISERNLFGLVSARENFQLKIAQSSVPWKIIQKPYFSDYPVKPSISNGFFIALVAGLIAGSFAAILRDKIDFVFHNKKDVEDYLKKKIIGEIPNFDYFNNSRTKSQNIIEKLEYKNSILDDKEKKIFLKQKFFFEESFRNLYSSIKFIKDKNKIKIIMITSSLANEGKSLINIMFAKTISDLGNKVLLIDGDLRKPKLHIRLDLKNKNGLSEFLAEDNIPYKDLLKTVKGAKNLSVITAGEKSIQPVEYLNSKKMNSLLKELSESDDFNFILIDGPQILGIADSLINSKFIDAYLLLVSLNIISKNVPLEAIERIEESNRPLLGILINRRNKNKDLQYISGRYGYGYSNNNYSLSETYFEEDLNKDDNNLYRNKIIYQIMLNINKQKTLNKLINRIKLFLIWLDN